MDFEKNTYASINRVGDGPFSYYKLHIQFVHGDGASDHITYNNNYKTYEQAESAKEEKMAEFAAITNPRIEPKIVPLLSILRG